MNSTNHQVRENWALMMTQNVACPKLQHSTTQCPLTVDPKSRGHQADPYTIPLGMVIDDLIVLNTGLNYLGRSGWIYMGYRRCLNLITCVYKQKEKWAYDISSQWVCVYVSTLYISMDINMEMQHRNKMKIIWQNIWGALISFAHCSSQVE